MKLKNTVAIAGLFSIALAAPAVIAADEPAAEELQWKFVPGIPRPIEVAIVSGDPGQPGPYVLRLRMPPGMKFAPHRYTDDRELKILKGTYWIASGESYNWRDMNEYKAGTVFKLPANQPHYFWARTNVIIEETGTGPTKIEYVHGEDDPRTTRKE